MRSFADVLIEAAVIGAMNCILIMLFNNHLNKKIDKRYVYFIVGAMIHLVFEYLGLNEWWCLSTYKT